MAGVFEFIVRAKDEATAIMEGIGSTGAGVASGLSDNWMGIAAGAAGAGLAIEAAARNQQDASVQSRQLAASLGLSEKEFRNLATETSNVTFPMEDVLNLMETGKQRGLDSKQALQDYALFWDTIGDATGESGPALGEAGVALQALGIAAGEEGKALDAFGYITENTTLGVGDFLQFVERAGPEIADMGLDVDQTAGLLGAMEKELGLSGKMARREFQSALRESDGTLAGLLATLGLTEEQFNAQTEAVKGSSEVIDRNAAIVAESFTPMQKFQHQVKEMVFQHGALIGEAAKLAPAISAIGPVMGVASKATKIMSVAQAGLNLVMSANPILLIVLALVALGAGLVIAYQKSETFRDIVNGTWESIQGFIMPIIDWFAVTVPATFAAINEAVQPILDALRIIWETVWGAIRDYIPPVFEVVRGVVETYIEIIRTVIETALGIIRGIWETVWGLIRDYLPPVWEFIAGVVGPKIEEVRAVIEAVLGFIKGNWETVWNGIEVFVGLVWGTIKGVVETQINAVKTVIEPVLNLIKGNWENVWNGINAFIDTIWNGAGGVVLTVDLAINKAKGFIDETLGKIETVWNTIWGGMRDTLSGIWDEIEGRVRGGVNSLIGAINGILGGISNLSISIPGFDTGIPGVPSFDGVTIGFPDIPLIPLLAVGGHILKTGLALVHEGETVVPAEAAPFGAFAGGGSLGSGGTGILAGGLKVPGGVSLGSGEMYHLSQLANKLGVDFVHAYLSDGLAQEPPRSVASMIAELDALSSAPSSSGASKMAKTTQGGSGGVYIENLNVENTGDDPRDIARQVRFALSTMRRPARLVGG